MNRPASLAVLAAALREHVPVLPGLEPRLRIVLEQAVARPGRLLRAQLAFTAAQRHGLAETAAARLATAIEYFHLASLLLDDLPCMDDAAERRGRACPHREHGEAAVILAALALINRAYALVGFLLPAFPPSYRLPVQACLDSCLGAGGLVGGQAADLRFATGPATAREAGRIARRKTGALFSLTLLLPAFLAAPRPDEFRQLKALGVYWGLAYQLADDLADLQDPEDNDRANLARLLGPAVAQARLARLRQLATATLRRLGSLHLRWSYLAELEARLLPARTADRAGLAA